MRRIPFMLFALFSIAAVLVPAASAKTPPTGRYGCEFNKILVIKSGHRYTYLRTKGTFTAGPWITFRDGYKGSRIAFKGGKLDGRKGRWYWMKPAPGAPVVPEIALWNPKKHYEDPICDKGLG